MIKCTNIRHTFQGHDRIKCVFFLLGNIKICMEMEEMGVNLYCSEFFIKLTGGWTSSASSDAFFLLAFPTGAGTGTEGRTSSASWDAFSLQRGTTDAGTGNELSTVAWKARQLCMKWQDKVTYKTSLVQLNSMVNLISWRFRIWADMSNASTSWSMLWFRYT